MIRRTEVVDADRNLNQSSNTVDTCGSFNIMELGGTEMKFKDIKFKETKMPKGIQALIKFGDYELSIIKNDMSYGGKNDGVLYEIGVFKGDGMVEMPGITQEGDTVKGFLSEDAVMSIIKKMHLVSGADPVAV